MGLWVYQQTGSVTNFAFIALASILPHLVLSPLASALVARWDRRKAMIFSDIGAGASTLLIAAFFFANRLEIWHIYLATALSSACGTFQWPAYTASISLLVPKKNLERANGMVQFGQAAAEVLTPILAGVLLVTIRLSDVILIDVATFIAAVCALLIVRIPLPASAPSEHKAKPSLLREAAIGWKYITVRSGLLGLLLFLGSSGSPGTLSSS